MKSIMCVAVMLCVVSAWGEVTIVHPACELTPMEAKPLSAGDRFYPVPHEEVMDGGPVIPLRFEGDERFRCDVRMGWSATGLKFDFSVLDPTDGPSKTDFYMFSADSVQIALDTRPEATKKGYEEGCFELGFAKQSGGKVAFWNWYPEKFDWSQVTATWEKVSGGYRMKGTIPWKSIGLKDGRTPVRLGVNVVVNEGQGATQRRYVQWTSGVCGLPKDPKQFAAAVLSRDACGLVRTDRDVYDEGEAVAGEFLEYGFRGLSQRNLAMVVDHQPLAGRLTLPLEAGSVRRVKFTIPAGVVEKEQPHQIAVESDTGAAIVPARITRFNEKAQVAKMRDPLVDRMTKIEEKLKANAAMREDAYVRLGLSVSKRFLSQIPFGGGPGKGPMEWIRLQLEEVDWVLGQVERRMEQLGRPGAKAFAMPRAPMGKLVIRDGQILADGKPFFFYGYGHHNTVDRELAEMNQFGTTLVQLARDARGLAPDGTLIWSDIATHKLPMGTQAGIRVDLLLSPHILPEWVIKADPDMWTGDVHFIKHNINHPAAYKIHQKWIETIVPRVKDSPALFGFCLTNEPSYSHSGRDKYTKPKWIEYLQKKYVGIDKLNAMYGTAYKDFAEVVVPEAKRPEKVEALRAYYDWMLFNQDNFMAWHRWMNDLVKKLAPGIPTHAKIIPNYMRAYMDWGIDVEEMSRMTDMAGNDCTADWSPQGPYAYQWQVEEIWYDLLHSLSGKPVLNTENHLIPDMSPAVHVPPMHTRSVLWQGGLHHQYATAVWIWQDETWGAGVPWSGSIYLRPGNIFSAGQAMLDLNRLSAEATAVNSCRPEVAILYSVPSMFWDDEYEKTLEQVYESLTFVGLGASFVSERQLAEGKVPAYKWIICPKTSHVEATTVDGLGRFMQKGGKVICVGSECFMWDSYHRKWNKGNPQVKSMAVVSAAKAQDFVGTLRSALVKGGMKVIDLEEIGVSTPLCGVEYRVVEHQGTTLVPIINFLHMAKTVRLGLTGTAVDLLSGEAVDLGRIQLNSMEPRFLQVKVDKGKKQ